MFFMNEQSSFGRGGVIGFSQCDGVAGLKVVNLLRVSFTAVLGFLFREVLAEARTTLTVSVFSLNLCPEGGLGLG